MSIQVTISFANKMEMLDFFGAGAVLAPAPVIVATPVEQPEAPKAKKSAKPAATPTVSATATTETTPADTVQTAPAVESPSEQPDPAPQAKQFTLEEVRAKLAALSQGGKTAEVKALLAGAGVTKLTDLKTDQYAAIMEKAGAL